jgi:hypothetical protein
MLSLRLCGCALVGAALTLTAGVADDLPPGAIARLGTPVAKAAQFGVPSVAFSPDGANLAWASNQSQQGNSELTIHLWDVRQKREPGKLKIDGISTRSFLTILGRTTSASCGGGSG